LGALYRELRPRVVGRDAFLAETTEQMQDRTAAGGDPFGTLECGLDESLRVDHGKNALQLVSTFRIHKGPPLASESLEFTAPYAE
jgi:hypothetical protein